MSKHICKTKRNAGTKMGEVMRARVCPDPAYVTTLRTNAGWMTARSIAAVHGHTCNRVAHALRRQAEAGVIEEDILDVAGTARSTEHMRVYRARPCDGEVRRIPTVLPGWLVPQVVAAVGDLRRIEGRAGMKRWDEAERVQAVEEREAADRPPDALEVAKCVP